MSEREAFMRAICDSPEDDTPRLVFADWLDEHGDQNDRTRAAFIRVQCEVARLATDNDQCKALTARARELQGRFSERWLGELPVPDRHHVHWVQAPDWLDGETFERGFAGLLRVQTAGFLAKHANT